MRPVFILIIVTIVSLLLISYQFEEKQTKQLVFADSDQPAFTLIYLADALGYFQAENLNVILDNRYNSGLSSLNATIQGAADIAGVFTIPIVHKAFEQNSIKIISTIYASPKTIGIVALRESNIQNTQDLIGKKIAVTLNTDAEFFLYLFLTSIEANLSQVRVFGVNPEAMAEYLASGQVDAIVTWQPHINNTETLLTKEKTITFYSSMYMSLAVLAVTEQVLTDKQDELTRFLHALKHAEEYLQENETQAAHLVSGYFAQHSNLSPLENLSWQSHYFKMGVNNVLLTTLEMQSIWMLENNLKAGAIPDFSQYLASKPLLETYPEAVTIFE